MTADSVNGVDGRVRTPSRVKRGGLEPVNGKAREGLRTVSVTNEEAGAKSLQSLQAAVDRFSRDGPVGLDRFSAPANGSPRGLQMVPSARSSNASDIVVGPIKADPVKPALMAAASGAVVLGLAALLIRSFRR